MTLEQEAKRITELLEGKAIKDCVRHKEDEVIFYFEGNLKLFVTVKNEGLELSIT